MNKPLSKGDIDRLGNKIREESNAPSGITLEKLQDYRISYKEVLSQIFNMLCASTRSIHPSSIVTYRIKRIESITGKLSRYPEMRFSRMWDIGGCRCILRNNSDVYKLKELIIKNEAIEIVKEYDYIHEPQKDGYKSLHLFIKFKSNNQIIEVQIRNKTDHNWATLVEISDLLFDSKLKEYGEDKKLLRFHYLLSIVSTLSTKEKFEISSILKEYNYFKKLSEVFSRNYLQVRKQWFDIESQNNHKFFLIETQKDDIPKISSFKSFYEAEMTYFNVYKSNQSSNIVLTHLPSPSYNQISVAYSNYILTFHSFLTECYDILESIIIESMQKREYYKFYQTIELYHSLSFAQLSNLIAEIKQIEEVEKEKGKRRINRSKRREWTNDINKQIILIQERGRKIDHSYNSSSPKNGIAGFIIDQIVKRTANKYQNQTKLLLSSNGFPV